MENLEHLALPDDLAALDALLAPLRAEPEREWSESSDGK